MTFNSGRPVALLLSVLVGLACGAERPPNTAPVIATTITTRCATCHMAPRPGSRTREALGVALSRHHKRVRLTDDQWEAVLDYLAQGSSATTPTQLAR